MVAERKAGVAEQTLFGVAWQGGQASLKAPNCSGACAVRYWLAVFADASRVCLVQVPYVFIMFVLEGLSLGGAALARTRRTVVGVDRATVTLYTRRRVTIRATPCPPQPITAPRKRNVARPIGIASR